MSNVLPSASNFLWIWFQGPPNQYCVWLSDFFHFFQSCSEVLDKLSRCFYHFSTQTKSNQNVVMPFLGQINVNINNNKCHTVSFVFLCALTNLKNMTSHLVYRKFVTCLAVMQTSVYSSKAFQGHHGQHLWEFHLCLMLGLCLFKDCVLWLLPFLMYSPINFCNKMLKHILLKLSGSTNRL